MARSSLIGLLAACVGVASCGSEPARPPLRDIARVDYAVRGAWLAPRNLAPLDSPVADRELASMRRHGVTHVAIGHDVTMPAMSEPVLTWGAGDDALREVLRSIRAAGMRAFLLPRIESPEFFEPPYPFRADIAFDEDVKWVQFHDQVERMLLHYAGLARDEEVAIFGVGLELKQSVRARPDRWRRMIAAVREVYPDGAVTYSANWYDEWEHVAFWDALDFIGIGAYFELEPEDGLGADASPVDDIAARWRPAAAKIEALAARVGRPVLFTEIGYTGYVDCVERPWEWTGKQDKGVAIDHGRQAEAYAGLFAAFGRADFLHGTFVWTWYADGEHIADWEYALQGRPAGDVLARAYGGAVVSGR